MALIREEKIGYYTLVPFGITSNPDAVAIRIPHPTDANGAESFYGAAPAQTIVHQVSPTVVNKTEDPGRVAKAFDEANARALVAEWNADIERGMIPHPGPIAALPDLLHPRAWRKAHEHAGLAVAVGAALNAPPDTSAKDAEIAALKAKLAKAEAKTEKHPAGGGG